ncbi:MAG: alpha/beta hydrolase [Candidatus Moranbacteria bacterium]|nr:alpha/beta hydrolase [Candidatus Moranbacteria bacterium]MDD3965098.1 alpha/beta hydrolase [Candidatus Moranbacteria bacterium]
MRKCLDRPIRTSFHNGEIIADVFLPLRQTGRIAILAGGLPSSPSQNDTLRFLTTFGYVAIFFRYRGTWESRGNFLEKSPARDIADILSDLKGSRKIHNIFLEEDIPIKVSSVTLFGSSFGGPAVLLNSTNPLVKKVIALSPVLDWQTIEHGSEPSSDHFRFIEQGYPEAYRVKKRHDWKKIHRPDFYNPLTNTSLIDGRKVFILHATDDTIVPDTTLPLFTEKTGATVYLKPRGGHFGLRYITHQFFWKKIQNFLEQ